MYRMGKGIACVGASALALSLIAACGAPQGTKTGDASSPARIVIKGSDTMVQLVQIWSEDFMKTHPAIEISTTGGGSGTGIAALLNGTTDICAASRPMQEKELSSAREKGITPKETIVGEDGIAIVVNPANPVVDLTMEQLKKIYAGAVTRWNQVGGPDQALIVYARESSSGTFVFFQEHVLNKEDYAPTARSMPATQTIIEAVASDQWAIGYVGHGYAAEAGSKVKILGIRRDPASAPVVPDEDNIRSGEYPIARPLFLYTGSAPRDAVTTFMTFCLSPEGQNIVKQTGYVPLKP